LTVALVYRRRTLPLAWRVYRGEKGHVTAAQVIALVTYVATFLPAQSPVWLIGDSGFHAVEFLRWLHQRHWHFVIRQPGHVMVCWEGQPWIKLGQLPLQPGDTRPIGWVSLTHCHAYAAVWLVLHWQRGEDEPWYVVSDQPESRTILRHYTRRMWIEEMYGDLKGHGFDLESTHLQDPARIARLVLGVCVVYVWFLTLGSWVVKRGYRPQLDRKERRDKSLFRLGWDWLEHCTRLELPWRLHFKPYW